MDQNGTKGRPKEGPKRNQKGTKKEPKRNQKGTKNQKQLLSEKGYLPNLLETAFLLDILQGSPL